MSNFENLHGTVSLNTKRLLLRQFKIDDANDMFNNWASDSRVTKYLTWDAHNDVDLTRKIINSWINQYDKKDFYQWAIIFKETNEVIGSISAFNYDALKNQIELGYCIAYKHWNKKITSEALQEVIKYLFNSEKINELIACHEINNVNSGKVMIKCGMKYVETKAVKSPITNNYDFYTYYSINNKEM